MKKYRLNKKRCAKNFGHLASKLLFAWIYLSIIDFGIAKSMCGGMHISDFNIVVVLYNKMDSLLQGFIF